MLYQYVAVQLINGLYVLCENKGTKAEPNWVLNGNDEWTKETIQEYILKDGVLVSELKFIDL